MKMQQEAIGESELFLDFQERLAKVAPIDRAVLILGERGVGKELAANRLHYLSKRWEHPFVTINCAALSSSLIESELFGHNRGAFTGATEKKIGRFEHADGGTLFLDELGALPFETQEKVLRVVEYGTFERVGSSTSLEVDVRVIGATNADLPQMVCKQKFKADLLDRLCFEVLFLPPLRLRNNDILLLADHFARKMAFELGRNEIHFSKKVQQQMLQYPWLGNIRELKNVVERAVYRCDEEKNVINEIVYNPFAPPWEEEEKKESVKTEQKKILAELPCSLQKELNEVEKLFLKKSLEKNNYNQKKAAIALGLSYDQFRSRLRKYKDIK